MIQHAAGGIVFFQKLSAIPARLQQPVNESCTARRKSSFCRAVRSLDHCDTGQGRWVNCLQYLAAYKARKSRICTSIKPWTCDIILSMYFRSMNFPLFQSRTTIIFLCGMWISRTISSFHAQRTTDRLMHCPLMDLPRSVQAVRNRGKP